MSLPACHHGKRRTFALFSLARTRVHYYSLCFFSFTAFTSRFNTLIINSLLVKANSVLPQVPITLREYGIGLRVKAEERFAFTRNFLKIKRFLLSVKE